MSLFSNYYYENKSSYLNNGFHFHENFQDENKIINSILKLRVDTKSDISCNNNSLIKFEIFTGSVSKILYFDIDSHICKVAVCVIENNLPDRLHCNLCLILERCVVTSMMTASNQEQLSLCIKVIRRVLKQLKIKKQNTLSVLDTVSNINRNLFKESQKYLTASHDYLKLTKFSEGNNFIKIFQYMLNFTCRCEQQLTYYKNMDLNNILESKPKYYFFIMKIIKDMLKVHNSYAIKILISITEDISKLNIRYKRYMKKLLNLWIWALAVPWNRDKRVLYKLLYKLFVGYKNCVSSDEQKLWMSNISDNTCENISNLDLLEDNRKYNVFLLFHVVQLSWNDSHLNNLLNMGEVIETTDENDEAFMWKENFCTSCVRINGLYLNGYLEAAASLCIATARAIIQQPSIWKNEWKEMKKDKVLEKCIFSKQNWLNQNAITHKIKPLGIFYNVLKDIPFIFKKPDKQLKYLQLAIEVIIIIISQQLMSLKYYHHPLYLNFIRNEQKWLELVYDITSKDNAFQEVKLDFMRIEKLVKNLSESGPFTAFGDDSDDYYYIPRYQWGYYMTKIIYPINKDLAFEIGAICLKYRRANFSSHFLVKDWMLAFKVVLSDLLNTYDKNEIHIVRLLNYARCFKDFKMLKMLFWSLLEIPKLLSFQAKNIIFEIILKQHMLILNQDLEYDVKEILILATKVSNDQLWNLLENWKVYFPKFSDIDKIDYCTSIAYLFNYKSNLERKLFTEKVFDYIMNCIEESEKHIPLFNALVNAIHQFSFTLEEQDLLHDKIFKLGIKCMTENPQSNIIYTLGGIICEYKEYTIFLKTISKMLSRKEIPINKMINFTQKEAKNNQTLAFETGLLVMKQFDISSENNVKQSSVVMQRNYIIWMWKMANILGKRKVAQIVQIVKENVKHPEVLDDIKKTCYKRSNQSIWIRDMLELL